jgi:alanine racemase
MDAKQTLGQPRLLISRDAILHNAALLRRRLQPGAEVCAVVKANAYGHGADVVVDALYNFSIDALEGPFADALAVATVEEAEQLPSTALTTYIMRPVENGFLGSQRSRIETAIRNGWVLTLCSRSAADDIARIALAVGKRAAVQVMVDTGMTRAGVAEADLADLLDRIDSHATLRLTAVGTHFAEAENRHSPFTQQQIERFNAALAEPMAKLKSRNVKIRRHAANSAGIFFHPSSHYDMVRPGLALYGIDPTFSPSMDRPLKPALKWTAPLMNVRRVAAGTSVGYGRTWIASRETTIGLVPVGYADGYLRDFSNCAKMIIHGRAYPVVGAVSMDSATLDLGPDSQAVAGDEVTVLDDDPLSAASVYALASLARTLPYEIFCRIGPRICRVAREAESRDDRVTR